MGIRLDYARAQRLITEAVEWARSDRPVPEEWTERTARVVAAPSKTFTPALGTALLAKATDPRVDALALKVESGEHAYSARTLCHNFLVPASVEFGFNLRATGREPLNNQPFFRYDRIDAMDRVHARSQQAHANLVETLTEVNRLNPTEALAAFTAFVRHRMQAQASQQRVRFTGPIPGLHQLTKAVDTFLAEDIEGGRRAQALVAAVCDITFGSVSTGRVNDPSRHLPGDVHVTDKGIVRLVAEVRAKSVTRTEIVQFSRALDGASIRHGLVAALGHTQPQLDLHGIQAECWQESGVTVTIVSSASDLLEQAALWSREPIRATLARFPDRMVVRLEEQDADPLSLERWAELCGVEWSLDTASDSGVPQESPPAEG